jgi:hypothetical protein
MVSSVLCVPQVRLGNNYLSFFQYAKCHHVIGWNL